jgi:aminoglycoside phosphotransferase (APT) family kinase protein
LPNNKVLKFCFAWVPEASVRQEAKISRAIEAMGLPVPGVVGICTMEGRFGIIYERVVGRSMLAVMAAKPWRLIGAARMLAALQARMHSISERSVERAALPSQRQRLRDKIQHAEVLEPVLRQASLKQLATLPGGARLCHGDFHPDNVLLTRAGPIIIDWIDATRGNPLADVARTSVILMGVQHGKTPSRIERVLLGWYQRLYLRRYFELRPGGEAEYQRWLPVVAAARMSEGIADIADWLHTLVKEAFT